ncbi:MAG: aromatic ring-hydroxylating dioxygenase subunit alpha [Gammaproteobacteria bacterium]|nr:aromatic ring-hydroxylating dioxygenase subunit alpha [Gammaproteobacteria bacterium]
MNSISKLIEEHKHNWSLQQAFYKDKNIYALEIERIYMNSWLFIGHESSIPNVGDYFLYDLLDESVILIRDKNSDIKAYMNVCRHRGSRICLEPNGNIKRFTCPYHAWTYNLSGSLIAANSLNEDIDKSKLSLHPCHIEVIEGLIFINFSDNPRSMDNLKRDMTEAMQMFGFKDLKIASQKTYPIASNWKLAVENYNECYHCGPAHPEYSLSHSLKIQDEPGYDQAQLAMNNTLTECGLKEITVDADYMDQEEGQEQYGYQRYGLFKGYVTGSKDGKPIAPLLGDIKKFNPGASDFNLGPVCFLLAYSDHVVGYVFTPVSHEQCRCDVYWMVDKNAKEGLDYDLENLMWLWDVTTLADEKIIVNNQKGVNSKSYRPGPFTSKELSEKNFIDWYLKQIKD